MNFGDPNALIASTAIGLVGLGIFLYGKKQARAPQLIVGIAMMIYPYFVPSVLAMCIVAFALCGLTWLATKLGL